MAATGWALVDDRAPEGTTLAGAVVDSLRDGRAGELAVLLDRWGALLRAAPAEVAFAATADNVAVAPDGALHSVRALRPGIDPLAADAPARAARVCLDLARTLVERAVIDDATLTVDALALRLGGQAGVAFDAAALERARAHEAAAQAALGGADPRAVLAAAEAAGTTTVLDAIAEGTVGDVDARRALARALSTLAATRAELARAEEATVELAATRALARSLGEELERDEWIRARLRNVKRTLPARALIAARKRVLRRG